MKTSLFGVILLLSTAFFLGILFLPNPAIAADPVTVSSPDGTIQVTLAGSEAESAPLYGPRFYYSVTYRGKPVMLNSPLGLEFKDMPALASGLILKDVEHRTVDEKWQRVWGKRKEVANHFNEVTVHLEENNPPNRSLKLVFRAYNDGVAFRYILPEQEHLSTFKLSSESTEFRFPDNHVVWAVNFGGFATHQESEYKRLTLNQLSPVEVYGCPLLVQVNSSIWVALTEADLTDWAGMYFSHAVERRNTLATRLSPRLDEPDVAVHSTAPRESPWRVVMIGSSPGDLIESDIVQNLNDPSALEDVSWIQPGKSAWDRWWSGSYAPEVDFEVGMNTATMKYYVDLAAEMGWEYQLVDWYWYGPPFVGESWQSNPESDITRVVPELDLPELVRYADSKGVKIILWLEWNHADRQMDEAFPLYEKWGIHGVKIDFMARDDQEMVNFYHRVVKKAAEHHLVVDFHGAYKPTGWSRTYPNLITREGVLGNEHNKWSDQVTPEHCVTLPFTRGLLGEMDFTPGGFRQKTRETFRVVGGDAPGPFVMGTRAFQLAMMVVYESALQVLCDSPYNYRSSPAGTDFLKIVPTTWDDTRVIHGQVGDFISTARRSGEDWYLGSMTDSDARILEIPLDFLGSGSYHAEIWADAPEAADYPDRIMKLVRTVTAKDTLTARLAPSGGQVVHLRPVR